MRYLVLAAVAVALVGAVAVKENIDVNMIGKETMVNMDVKMKEMVLMRLLNHILQPTMHRDIKDCAREFILEDNLDKFIKPDVVRIFMNTWKMGMMPRGEVFVHTSELQMKEAIKVFHVLYFAKDFDTFVRCCCWMRERINEGMFVYAMTVAVLHRDDCHGVVLPAPYEIYPNYFVNSDVIHKALMMKLKKGAVDRTLLDYYNIKETDKNMVIIDSRKDVRHTMSTRDMLTYFTEDIDLNTYFYYFHMDYPTWMTKDIYNVNKDRRGEIVMYGYQQLLARKNLERLSHEMCRVKPLMFNQPLKLGYWPKIRLSNGEAMPVRSNDKLIVTEDKLEIKRLIDDMEKLIREAILTGTFETRDGTILTIRKPEDLEVLCRIVLGTYGWKDDAKVIHLMNLFKKMMGYNLYSINKYTYIPTSMDMLQTCLRDPVFWKLLKRLTDNVVLFKKMLPKYTREELDFPGVKIDSVMTDKLVTFMDDQDIDITNAVYFDETEIQKGRSDKIFVARQRRLNHQPFKVTIDVMSDKTVDSVVRVFLGPKYDCMGRLMDINDKRLDMVEMDSFVYKLETGKNTIVRDSIEMHNVIEDRPWTRRMWDRVLIEKLGEERQMRDGWWHRSRTGFPSRLLLPMGRRGGLEMQLLVVITPMRTGKTVSTLVDMDVMRSRKVCRFTACMDTLPLGFPLDREIDMSRFWTNNIRMVDVMIFHKDLEMSNSVKDMDQSMMVMKRDDLTMLDKDMLVNTRFVDPVLRMDNDRMLRM